jgi:hypothetical protein
LVELADDLPQRQAAGPALTHEPDHALFGLVLYQAIVLIVIAEGELAGMGAVAAILGDAAPFQSSERSGAAYFC